MKEARLAVFSLSSAVAYTLAYYFDWPLFVYDLGGGVRFFVQAANGPAILWYGWIATAIAAGVVTAVVVPPRLVARFLPDLVWLLPGVLIVAAFMYEKRWFM